MRCQICAVSLDALRTRLPVDPLPIDPEGWIFSRERKAAEKGITTCSILSNQSGCQDRDVPHPNGHSTMKEHVPGPGCNSNRAYSGLRISHLEMQRFDETRFIVEKPTLNYGRPGYEEKSSFCIPIDPACITDEFGFWAFERGEGDDDERGNGYNFTPRNIFSEHQNGMFDDIPSSLGFPVHSWCWDLFEKACVKRAGEVDLQGFAALFFREACFGCGFADISHHPAIAQNQDPSDIMHWKHTPGTEFLAANPQNIPGFLFSLQQNYSITLKQQIEVAAKSPAVHTNMTDLFARLPLELRTQIAQDLSLTDFLSLRTISRAFQLSNQSPYLHFIKRDFPWFDEFNQVKALNDSYHAILQSKKDDKIASIKVEIQKHAGTPLESRWSRHLTEDFLAPPPARLPNWEQLYKNLYVARRELKGVKNRVRIWRLVEDIVERIRLLRGRVGEEWDEERGIMLLPAKPKEPVMSWETWKETQGCCLRCMKIG